MDKNAPLRLNLEEEVKRLDTIQINKVQVKTLVHFNIERISCLNMKRWENYWLPLCPLKYSQDKFIAKVNKLLNSKLPKCLGLSIHGIGKSRDKEVLAFLTNSFPEKAESFIFEDFGTNYKKSLHFYSGKLFKVLPCVTRNISLAGFVIQKHHFESLIHN